MEMLEKDTVLRLNFFGKRYVFERQNPFTVEIALEDWQNFVNFSMELFVGRMVYFGVKRGFRIG